MNQHQPGNALGTRCLLLAVSLAIVASACGDATTVPLDDAADTHQQPDDVVADGDVEVSEDGSGPLDADADVAADAEDVAEQPETVDDARTYTGHPGEELVVRITEPASGGAVTTSNSTVRLTGLLFGDASSVQWQLGVNSGNITPAPYWASGPIVLAAGDNRITVTASNDSGVTSDTIVVTYNPTYRFAAQPRVAPNFAWVGQSRVALFNIELEPLAAADPTSPAVVIEVDAQGGFVRELAPLADDGDVGRSGDEIAGDGIHSAREVVVCTDAGPHYYRVRVPLVGGGAATSESIPFDCLTRLAPNTCASAQALLANAMVRLADGDSADAVLDELRASAMVAAAGGASDGGRGLWVHFADGFLGLVPSAEAGRRSLAAAPTMQRWLGSATTMAVPVGSLKTLVGSALAAGASEEAPADEARWLASATDGTQCPPLTAIGAGDGIELADLRRAGDAGVIALATHGGVFFAGLDAGTGESFGWRHRGAQEVFMTSTASQCDALLVNDVACVVTPRQPDGDCDAGLRCQVVESFATPEGAAGRGYCLDETQAELRRGQIALSPAGYAVTPQFFERWASARGLDGAFIYLGACSSAWNGSLASTLTAGGAAAVVGYSGRVSETYADTTGRAVLGRLLASEPLSGADIDYGTDPEGPGVEVRIVGADQLLLGGDALLNADFGAGTAGGWTIEGDGRILTRFGAAAPVTGKFMGFLSTGLGYRVGAGALSQTVCVPDNVSGLSFYWRVYSEEFVEWCGEVTSQDVVTIRATDVDGASAELARIAVDDLCGYAEGTCTACPQPVACDPVCFGQQGCHFDAVLGACTGTYACGCGRYFAGLEPSDVQFDQGGVWRTTWRQNRVDLSGLAGRGPVTLRFGIADSGDSLFDSALLLDALVLD